MRAATANLPSLNQLWCYAVAKAGCAVFSDLLVLWRFAPIHVFFLRVAAILSRPALAGLWQEFALLCHQCGSPVEASDRSCPNCGASLVKTTRFDIATSRGLRISQELKAIKIDDQIFPPGELIGGRYALGELIGKGPFGEVYRAHDRETDVDVAVKVFDKELNKTPRQQEKFSAAARQARGMSQANVVRVHDSGVHKGHPWVSMQYLEGLSLRKVLGLRRSKGEHFSLEEIEPVIGQIGLALSQAGKDVPVVNLKPENIIFMPDLLKVTDTYVVAAFGLDVLRERLNDSPYLAPELHTEGAQPDARADVYSLGVIIGEMAFGAEYNPGSNVPTALKGLDSLCRRATAFSRDERYASVEALIEGLTTLVDTGSLLESSNVSAPPAPPVAPPAPPKPPIPPRSRGGLPAAGPPAGPAMRAEVDLQSEEDVATVEYNRDKDLEIQDLLSTNEVSRTPLLRPETPKGSENRVHTLTVNTAAPVSRHNEADNSMKWAGALLVGIGVAVIGVVVMRNQTSSSDGVVQLSTKSQEVAVQNVARPPQAQPVVQQTAVQPTGKTASQTIAQVASVTAAQTANQGVAAQTANQGVTRQTATQVALKSVGSAAVDTSGKTEPRVETSKEMPVEKALVAAAEKKGPEVKDVAKAAGTSCPSGSLLVKSKSGNYCVDAYEYPGAGSMPKTRVNWFEAKKLCTAAGKRLCSLSEWRGACGSKYPYGSSFNANSCNTADEDGFERSLAKTGSNRSCKSRVGAYDMSGNVHEWVEEKQIAGGSYESDEDVASCRYSSAKAPGSTTGDIGFRCCADPE